MAQPSIRTLVLVASMLGVDGCSDQDRQWSGPQELDPNPPAFYQTLVASGDGRALAVWRGPNPESDPEPPERYDGIYASWKSPAGSWGPATVVDAFLAQSYPPAVAAGPNGDAIVVWAQTAGTREVEVWASRYEVGGPWSEPELVGDAGLGLQESPTVAIGADGRAFVTWWLRDGRGGTSH